MALSGGVDSTVAATLIHKAVGDQLTGVFVDNGVLRKDEFNNVLISYAKLGLNVDGVDAKERFYSALSGKTDPEAKRKAIGSLFIDIFQEEAKKVDGVTLLDRAPSIRMLVSVSVHGPSLTIKSPQRQWLPDHHT
jgi:GMP synthase (glutamine-hydrolysing)